MNEIVLFDANCHLGHAGGLSAPMDAAELVGALDQAGIAEALVTHSSAVAYDPAHGNELLREALTGNGRLCACWVVMPHHTGEMPEPQALVRQLLDAGARAARLYPKRVGPLREYLYGPLLGVLQESRVPLLIDFELGHWGAHMQAVDWDGLGWLLGRYPRLPVVLPRLGQAVDRMLLPFMDLHANLHLETSYYIGSGALERLAARVGAERLLFGTGMPRYAPGPAITLLTYSGLGEADKALVGAGNLRRLLSEAGG